MENVLNYIGLLTSGLSLSFILLLCFCWNKKHSLLPKRSNSNSNVSIKSFHQKNTHGDQKRLITCRLKCPFRSGRNPTVADLTPAAAAARTSGDITSSNHVIIKNSNLFDNNEGDLAYATTIGLRGGLNNADIISPGYTLLRQESNSHRNCELPPVPTYSDTNFIENKPIKTIINHEQEDTLEDISDQLTYYSVPAVKRSIENDQNLYDIAIIPKLHNHHHHQQQQQRIKLQTNSFESNSRCYSSLCDDAASDSDGLYASVNQPPPSIPPPPLPLPLPPPPPPATAQSTTSSVIVTAANCSSSSSTLRRDLQNTKVNSNAQRRYEICQSPYYSQLNDDCDVTNENSKNNKNNNNSVNDSSGKVNPYGELIITTTNPIAITPNAMATMLTTTTGAATSVTATTLPTDISNMPSCGDGCAVGGAGVNNNFPCKCHSGKQQATSQMPGNRGDCCICSCTTPSSHLYAQVLPRKRSVTDPETMSNCTIYSSNYIRPPIPARCYDQAEIDLVNQIRTCSRQLDTICPSTECKILTAHSIHKEKTLLVGSNSPRNDRLLINNHQQSSGSVGSACGSNSNTGGGCSPNVRQSDPPPLLESNYRHISVRESLANLRARNALPVLYSIIKHDHGSIDITDLNQESSEYERIYPESADLLNCTNRMKLTTSSSNDKHNSELNSRVTVKHVEHSYAELPGTDSLCEGTYAQVYSTVPIDDSSLLRTRATTAIGLCSQCSPVAAAAAAVTAVDIHPGVNITKNNNTHSSCHCDNSAVFDITATTTSTITTATSSGCIDTMSSKLDGNIYNVPELYPNSLASNTNNNNNNNLNDRMLAEIQAFRHMDSELDLTQSAKTVVTGNSETSHLLTNEHPSASDDVEKRRTMDNVYCSSKPQSLNRIIIPNATPSSVNSINEMTPLMERSTEDFSLPSTMSRKYLKQGACDGGCGGKTTVNPCTSSSSLSSSSSLLLCRSSVLSPSSSSLCKSIKSPLIFSMSDLLQCDHSGVVITTSSNTNQSCSGSMPTARCSPFPPMTIAVAPFARAELTCISDTSAYDEIDNLSPASTSTLVSNKSLTPSPVIISSSNTKYPTVNSNKLGNGAAKSIKKILK
ncbi:unnamed protein product [Trichobilharzia szidati]|nr:unnamed protein product [Trichobilharzia szidati]